jgi:DNA-binding IclR family transcriptional regulator
VLSALVSQKGAANLSSIAQAAALSASQTHRYLSSLIEAGMVKQEHRSGLYDLDSEAIRLGLAALSRADIFTMADTTFRRLARDSRRTCQIAVWGDAGPTIVRWFDGAPPVITSQAIGSVLPPLRSATGRVFCTFADPAQIERVGKAALRAERNAVPDIDRILATVKATGLAVVKGDLVPGLRAMAAPVFDLQGRLVLVASMLANDAFPPSDDEEAGQHLLAACRELTEAFGGTWPIEAEPPARGRRRPPAASRA